MSEKGTVYFFTGLAGAGKTTIGGLFHQRMKARGGNVILIDGDQMRYIFGRSGYSTEERLHGAWSLFRLCKMLSDQGIDVVCCSMSLYEPVRVWNRRNIEKYREIYIKVTMDTLYHRDQKGLYTTGRKNVVGVDLPYDEPQHSDFVIQNDGQDTPESIVEQLEYRFKLIQG